MHRSLRIGTGSSFDSGPISAATTNNNNKSGPYEGKIAGLYDLEETLGRGHFAVVKLARHVFTGEKVAVKVIDKSKLDEVSRAHLFQEVRCMKLVQHPNVVRLYEVIDTATKLYLILELADGGDLYDYIMRHDTGLSEQIAKEYFRQIVRAISYCHQLHVVHRDLKPENVVFFEKLGVVKLTDFGFSNKFCPGQKLETSCGSLAYSAPEILLGDSYDAPAVDIWSLGVILYMLVCGQAPFQEANDSETLTMIMDCKYSIPAHVSKDCQNLIARMLVRNPEKRATLSEIANHPWLAVGKLDNPPLDVIPLVSREQLSEEDHNLIVQKIVNGNIASKEEIQECLDKNEYNHITATYYLLAERKLRSKRQDQMNKCRRPENLTVPHNSPAPKRENNGTGQAPCLLTVPRTPGDVPQRTRKCSIVQEDEEEEDISSCSGREELAPPLNRRGSRSEGRLNLALQERLVETDLKKPSTEKLNNYDPVKKLPWRNKGDLTTVKPTISSVASSTSATTTTTIKPTNTKWSMMGKSASLTESPVQVKIMKNIIPTTIITDSSTISIPIVTTNTSLSYHTIPKYKTMPSPTRTNLQSGNNSHLQLNEIFEESDNGLATGATTMSATDVTKGGDAASSSSSGAAPTAATTRQFVSRNQNKTNYEQRRSKFHKARTASCSSSDASDDDSEKRKKRAHKLTTPTAKPFQGRRDSHDDSSDSQEPGSGIGGGGGSTSQVSTNAVQNTTNITSQTNKNNDQTTAQSTNTGGGGRKNTSSYTNVVMLGRRHKASRRRTGETRLRESQSLNRITEVQEDSLHHNTSTVISSSSAATAVATSLSNSMSSNIGSGGGGGGGSGNSGGTKNKSFGAKFLYGFTTTVRNNKSDEKLSTHISRKDTLRSDIDQQQQIEINKEISHSSSSSSSNNNNNKVIPVRKMRLLGKYFQVHKKLCIPLPALFNRNRLYKAQSCSSLSKDRIDLTTENILSCRQRAVSMIRKNDGDINQNKNDKTQQQRQQQQQQQNSNNKSSTVVQLNNVCNELTGICAVHLGQASKCCSSFC